MWLSYLIVPLILLGIVSTALGIAPVGIGLLLIGVVLAAYRFSDRFKAQNAESTSGNANNADAGVGEGFAHKGQSNMVP